MLELLSLQSIFLQQIEDNSSEFGKAISQYLQNQIPPPHELLDKFQWREPLFSEEKTIENWRKLLALTVFSNLTEMHQKEVASKVAQFERRPWNQNSQYFRSLVALNHALVKMPALEAGPHLLESGAALIEVQEYCPWLSLPFTPQHFEFGIYLCMLALLTKREDLHNTVLRITHWQLNTLDSSGKPLPGLFVREKDGSDCNRLCLSYLLFRAAALLNENTPFAAVSDKILKSIQQYFDESNEKVEPLWALIEKWLDQYKILSCSPFILPENIQDPSTALVGYRSHSMHIACTLHGSQTGLGCLNYGGVEIVTYGPQYLPLAECDGFGIEGNSLSDHGMRRSSIETYRSSFVLKGCTRMVDQPSVMRLESKFRNIWIDVVQEFKNPHLYLKTTFLGLDGWDSVAFCFYVKADACKVSGRKILPCTLERYEGDAATLLFESKGVNVEFRPLAFKDTKMQVIPLSGGNHFWGADFLVAYLLDSNQRQYQWHIGPPRHN